MLQFSINPSPWPWSCWWSLSSSFKKRSDSIRKQERSIKMGSTIILISIIIMIWSVSRWGIDIKKIKIEEKNKYKREVIWSVSRGGAWRQPGGIFRCSEELFGATAISEIKQKKLFSVWLFSLLFPLIFFYFLSFLKKMPPTTTMTQGVEYKYTANKNLFDDLCGSSNKSLMIFRRYN